MQTLNIFSKNNFFKYFITSNLNKNLQITGLSSYYFFLFNQLFFSQLLKTPCTLMSFNSRDIIPKNLIYYAVHSAKLIRWKKFNIIHSNEIMETLFLCL
jgi:predicted membrane-bound dolichyl-phosphate-mannose-protein mannosyltransferase